MPDSGSMANAKCGSGRYSVPEGRGASFFCRPTLYGRYVFINHRKIVLTLCEVEVYSAHRGMLSQISRNQH